MKVAIVQPKPPWFHGGVERITKEVAIRIKNRINIEIFCTSSNSNEVGDYIWNDIPVHVNKGSNVYYFSPSLYNSMKKSAFDLIHSHSFTSFTHIVALLTKKNKPLIFSPHFHPYSRRPIYSFVRRYYDSIIVPYILKSSDLIVCDSYTECRLLFSKYSLNKKSVVIPNGVNDLQIKKTKPYNFDGYMILYVGRLEKHKNIHLIIQAMKYLPTDFYLYILGNGSYKKELEKLVEELNLRKRVKIISEASDEGVYRYLKTCTVFVTLSELETFCMTCLEALAASKPVIVNNDGLGCTEVANIFKQAINLFDIKRQSPRDLSILIQNMTEKKIAVDLTNYTWENIATKFLKLYKSYS